MGSRPKSILHMDNRTTETLTLDRDNDNIKMRGCNETRVPSLPSLMSSVQRSDRDPVDLIGILAE